MRVLILLVALLAGTPGFTAGTHTNAAGLINTLATYLGLVVLSIEPTYVCIRGADLPCICCRHGLIYACRHRQQSKVDATNSS